MTREPEVALSRQTASINTGTPTRILGARTLGDAALRVSGWPHPPTRVRRTAGWRTQPIGIVGLGGAGTPRQTAGGLRAQLRRDEHGANSLRKHSGEREANDGRADRRTDARCPATVVARPDWVCDKLQDLGEAIVSRMSDSCGSCLTVFCCARLSSTRPTSNVNLLHRRGLYCVRR